MVRQRGSARDRRIRSRSLSGRMSRKKSRMRLRYAWGANCLCSLQSTSNLAAAIPAAARRIVQERQLRGRQWRCTVWKGRRWVSNWPTLSSLVPKRSVIEEEEKQKEKTEKREVWIWTACGRPGCLWFAAYFAQSCRRDELYGGAVEGSKGGGTDGEWDLGEGELLDSSLAANGQTVRRRTELAACYDGATNCWYGAG